MAEDKKISKDLQEDSKRRIKNEADFQDIIKDSLNLLKQMDASYEKLEARINSMNKSSINIKDINREIQKATEKQYTAEKQLSELKHADTDSVKEYLNNLKYINDLEIKIRNSKGEEKKIHQDEQALLLSYKDDMFETLSAEEQSYANALQTVKIGQEGLHIAQAQLSTEKQIEKSIGVTGKAMGILATKLGLGSEYYEDMVEKARELNKRGEEFTFGDKLKSLKKLALGAFKEGIKDPLVVLPALYKGVSKVLDTLGGATTDQMSKLSDSDAIQKMTSGVSGLLKNIPFVGGLLGGMVDSVSAFLDLTISASSKVQKMGRELGLSAEQALQLNNSFNKFSNSVNDSLVNSQKLFETQIELGNQLGVLNTLSNDRLQTDIHLKEIAGLDLETRGSLVESSVILGKNQKDIMNSVFAQVEGLKRATGIQLNQKGVLKEASNLGGYLGLTFAKYPATLTKSLVTIKAMGLEIKQLDSMADSFLDFESSISSEFEAQLLTGKDINLMKARELFLTNDLAGAAQEITSQVGSSSEFLKLNRIQAESMAKAFGMSRDQMADMLKKQEYMSKIGAKDTDNAQKQYQLALAKYGTQKEMSKALGEDTANSIMNASAQEKIAGFMDKIKQGFVDLISNSNIVNFINRAIDWLGEPKNIETIINKLQSFFSTVLEVTGSVVGGIMKFLNLLPGIDIDKDLIDTVSNLGSSFGGTTIGGGGNAFSSPATVSDGKARSEGTPATALQSAGSTSAPKIVVQNNQEFNINPYTAKVNLKQFSESSSTSTDKSTGFYGKQ